MDHVKKIIEKENEFIRTLNETKLTKVESTQQLPFFEIEKLRNALLLKKEEVNWKYQGLTHANKVNTTGFRRRKEGLEKELDQIDKDIILLQNQQIMVELN